MKLPRNNAHDYGLSMLAVLLFPLILLAALLVEWVFSDCADEQGDD